MQNVYLKIWKQIHDYILCKDNTRVIKKGGGFRVVNKNDLNKLLFPQKANYPPLNINNYTQMDCNRKITQKTFLFLI